MKYGGGEGVCVCGCVCVKKKMIICDTLYNMYNGVQACKLYKYLNYITVSLFFSSVFALFHYIFYILNSKIKGGLQPQHLSGCIYNMYFSFITGLICVL